MHYTINDLRQDFPDDEACLKELLARRYPDWQCACKRTKLYKVRGRPVYACACGLQVRPLADTIFARTKIPLTQWFYVMYVMSHSKSGISAINIQKHLGVTYKTAWRMTMKIREMMVDNDPLVGEIEADETYLRAKPWRTTRPLAYNGRAQTVFGMAERGGRAKAFAIPTNSKHFLLQHIEKHSNPKVMYTDGWPAYKDLGLKYKHYTVQHSKGEYVNDHIHTNNIENFWGGVKRAIYGVYRLVHPEYLQKYLNQFAWVYSNRFSQVPLFNLLLNGLNV